MFPMKILDTGFSDKASDHSNLKILTSKQIGQRLPIALAQVKAGNTSKNSLNEIRQIICSFHQANGIPKKVYDSIVSSVKIQHIK